MAVCQIFRMKKRKQKENTEYTFFPLSGQFCEFYLDLNGALSHLSNCQVNWNIDIKFVNIINPDLLQ